MTKPELLFLLNTYGIKPQRSKGQNFLLDQRVITQIVRAAELTRDTLVVEVGPGIGVLTSALTAVAPRVIAVELDRRLLPLLEKLKVVSPQLQIVSQDILNIDFQQLTNHQSYVLVGNLPYNSTSAILKHAVESNHQPERMVVMVQREVGERILATPGDMSLLALSIQLYGTPEQVTIVSRTAFHPQPEVTSMVLKIKNIHQPTDVNPQTLFKLAHAAFQGKRKQLHNTLAAGLHLTAAATQQLLDQANIHPAARPQHLSVEQWKTLANAFDHFPQS